MWVRRPTAREILDDRVARGWKPTPSMLNDGDEVLGYASCLVDPNHRGGPDRSDGTNG